MRRFVLLVLLTLGCVGFCRAEWILFDVGSDGDKWYVNSTVSSCGYNGCSQVWIKVEYSKPQYLQKKRYNYVLDLWQFDSKCRKIATTSVAYYKSDGTLVYSWDDKYASTIPEWEYVKPDTMAETIAEYVRCVTNGFPVTFSRETENGETETIKMMYEE